MPAYPRLPPIVYVNVASALHGGVTGAQYDAVQPLISVAVTQSVVEAVAEEITVAPVLLFNNVAGDHVYVYVPTPPVATAVSSTKPPVRLFVIHVVAIVGQFVFTSWQMVSVQPAASAM